MINTPFIDKLVRWISTSQFRKHKKTILFTLAGIITVISFSIAGAASDSSSISTEISIWFYLGVLAKLGGILMLIVGGSVLFRKWQGKLPGNKPMRQLTVIESVRLSPRQTLHLVQAGSQQLVIGATDQGIALISEIQPVKNPGAESMQGADNDFPYIFKRMVSPSSVIESTEMSKP